MDSPGHNFDGVRRIRVHITGLVQGVGFRPFVWTLARELELVGWVRNDSGGVTIEIQGNPSTIDLFLELLPTRAPAISRIDSMQFNDIRSTTGTKFEIHSSVPVSNAGTPILPDLCVCDACLCEFNDPANRRFAYPFINCTHCGPRFTIVQDIPYDRPLTTMKAFTMCERCQREYDDPADRRFHAQPNACPECGPRIWLTGMSGDRDRFLHWAGSPQNTEAIVAFRKAIALGQIVAVKGIGGFHLACDATSDLAIRTLRDRKGRMDKPFAVMFSTVGQAREFVQVTDQEQGLLEGRERPIVLLARLSSDSARHRLSQLIAPGNDFLGVLLPYSPLHSLLTADGPLVLTSGNISDEPIARTNIEACDRLQNLADCFLLHDREINVVCDDSVVRCIDGQTLPIRRSRGYSPMPVRCSSSGGSVLAIGGEIKAAFCVTRGEYAFMSQHIGDMGNLETLEAMKRSVDHFLRIFRADVEAIGADLHPGYLSGHWAEQLARELGIPIFRVQHHFAHVVSLIADSDSYRKVHPEKTMPHIRKKESDEQRPVSTSLQKAIGANRIIGCCFDGTGYGTDGTIWGGEFLVADTGSFMRFATISSFPLPGGDACARNPFRTALALLWASGLEWDERLPSVQYVPEQERKLLKRQLERNVNCIATTSMGRLFDAVASLAGIRHTVTYEAQAAMEMETLAASVTDLADIDAWPMEIVSGKPLQVTTGPMLRELCNDVLTGIPAPRIAARFHWTIAQMVVEVCRKCREEYSINRAGLTGGVFQNVFLQRMVKTMLADSGFEVLVHRAVPPNDGGIALGQATVVRNWIAGNGREESQGTMQF